MPLEITSDDFKGDPYGAVTNQCGHIIVGLAVAVLMGLSTVMAAPLAALVYWIWVEVIVQGNKLWRDSLMDTAFVMAGVALHGAILQGDQTGRLVIAVIVAMLAFEAWSKR